MAAAREGGIGAQGVETTVCGIVLHPAGHARSPAMHNAAFRALGLDAVYLAFDVPPEALGAAIAGARALGLRPRWDCTPTPPPSTPRPSIREPW